MAAKRRANRIKGRRRKKKSKSQSTDVVEMVPDLMELVIPIDEEPPKGKKITPKKKKERDKTTTTTRFTRK